MTNTIWKNGISGDWATGIDWLGGVPTASEDAIINAKGAYTVAISSADIADSLTIDAAGANLSENSGGSLTMAGGLTIDAGTVVLNGANSFGEQTLLIGGTLELGNVAALGDAGLAIDGGALVGIANFNFANTTTTDGSFTMAAAHGDVVKLTGQTVLNMHGGDVIDFGETGDDGVFVWAPLTLGVANGGAGFSVNVNAGILRDGNASLSEVLGIAASTTVAAGATIDIHGNAETINNLNGSGAVMSQMPGGALIVDGGNFAGEIKSTLSLTVNGSLTLSGSNTYTGGTTINSGATLVVAHGGSFPGNITDNGVLDFHLGSTRTVTLHGGISGTGVIDVDKGSVLLDGTNTYSGGTTLTGGVLEIGNAAATGTGQITLADGTLMGTTDEALSNQLVINKADTFLAAHGTTLTLNTGAAWTIGSKAEIAFGSSVNDGVIVWDSPAGSSVYHSAIQIAIDGGTLRAGDGNFQTLLDAANTARGTTDILQGGTLDVAGFASTVYHLAGDGTIGNSGASATVTIDGGTFYGDFSGSVVLNIGTGITYLGQNAANWGTINLLSNATLHLFGASSSNIVFSPGDSAKLGIDDFSQFTGSVTGFAAGDWMLFPYLSGISVHYSGTTAGGTLTVSSALGSVQITMVGDYLDGAFSVKGSGHQHVVFTPKAAAASAHVDSFDFGASVLPHIAADASVTHMHGGHSESDVTFAHNMTEALHVHEFGFDHFAHGLFVHEHAFAEALA